MNSLYGVFGRSNDLIETKTINKTELLAYSVTNLINHAINISRYKCTILMSRNINYDIVQELNLKYSTILSDKEQKINNNVAVASAVTSYARIIMIQYKSDPGVVYTDTDSIFTTTPLDPTLLGKEIGLMKDEMSGTLIQEGYFLGIKRYGY
jgi:hypothetical protein